MTSAVRPDSRAGSDGWLLKSLDAVLTAPLHLEEQRLDLARLVLRLRGPKCGRISSAVALLDRLTPGHISRRWASSLTQLDCFPFKATNVRVIARGTSVTAFALDVGGQRKVLKVFRRSLAAPARERLELIGRFRQRHARLCAWFNEAEEVVVPSVFLVLHAPLLGVAAAAVLQPHLDGTGRDIFLDYSVDEAVRLLLSDPQLAGQWIRFSRRFLETLEQTHTCFDLVGRENLMLVRHEGKLALRIADNGIFEVDAVRVQAPARYVRLQAHVRRLNEITAGVAAT